jgi:hypothetical protein
VKLCSHTFLIDLQPFECLQPPSSHYISWEKMMSVDFYIQLAGCESNVPFLSHLHALMLFQILISKFFYHQTIHWSKPIWILSTIPTSFNVSYHMSASFFDCRTSVSVIFFFWFALLSPVIYTLSILAKNFIFHMPQKCWPCCLTPPHCLLCSYE